MGRRMSARAPVVAARARGPPATALDRAAPGCARARRRWRRRARRRRRTRPRAVGRPRRRPAADRRDRCTPRRPAASPRGVECRAQASARSRARQPLAWITVTPAVPGGCDPPPSSADHEHDGRRSAASPASSAHATSGRPPSGTSGFGSSAAKSRADSPPRGPRPRRSPRQTASSARRDEDARQVLAVLGTCVEIARRLGARRPPAPRRRPPTRRRERRFHAPWHAAACCPC